MTYLTVESIYNVEKQQDNTAVMVQPSCLHHHRPSLRIIMIVIVQYIISAIFIGVCVCVCVGGLSHVMMYLLMIGRDVYTTIFCYVRLRTSSAAGCAESRDWPRGRTR